MNILRTYLPEIGAFTVCPGTLCMRTACSPATTGPTSPTASRVLREWNEVTRRVADGSLDAVDRVNGAWQ